MSRTGRRDEARVSLVNVHPSIRPQKEGGGVVGVGKRSVRQISHFHAESEMKNI